MPKKPIDFSKNIIYTIRSGKSIYVGSTTNYVKRKTKHKCSIYNENGHEYNYKLYKKIRENKGIWDMQPHSKYPCNDVVEQTIEEQRICLLLKADLNSQCCGTGLNRSELGKQEYEKQYYVKNKEKLLEHHKQYNTVNKDKISEYQKQKVTCDCGCILTRTNLPKHKKTKKHLKLMENK
jgi:hypothetical protein